LLSGVEVFDDQELGHPDSSGRARFTTAKKANLRQDQSKTDSSRRNRMQAEEKQKAKEFWFQPALAPATC